MITMDRKTGTWRGILSLAFAACMALAMVPPARTQRVVELAPAASVSRVRTGGCVPAGLPPEGLAYARLICRQIRRWVPAYVTAADPWPAVRSNENSVVRTYVPHARRASRRTHPAAAVDERRSERVAFHLQRHQSTVRAARHSRAAGPRDHQHRAKPTGNVSHGAAPSAAVTPRALGPVESNRAAPLPGRPTLASHVSRVRGSARPEDPPRPPIALILMTFLGVVMLVLGLRRHPALVRYPRPFSLPRAVRICLGAAFRARRVPARDTSLRSTSSAAKVTVVSGNDMVRQVDGVPDPREPLHGWPCAGPIAVDVGSASGVIGVCGAGVVRAALDVLTASERCTVVITAECVQELYGADRPEGLTVVRTLDEAIGLIHAVLVERLSAEEDGQPASDERDVWLCARSDAQQARLRSLFDGATGRGVRAVLLGDQPFGPSLTVDDDGRVVSAPSAGERLIDSYFTTLARGRAATETSPAAGTEFESPPVGPAPSDAGSGPPGSEGTDGRPQLEILGPERIKVNGLELPGALERRFSWEVATYLACHREGATADIIIEDLWPDEPLISARKRFTDAVYHLRKALRAASGQPHGKFVLLRMNRYRLDETQLNVDLWEFESAILASRSAPDAGKRLESLRKAIRIYRGEFVYVGDGLWAESFRHDLRRKAFGALDEAALLLETNDPGMAVTMLEDAGRIMPWAEEADRHIMRIYQRLGRLDDARGAYEAMKERLRGVGEEPGSETRELLQKIVVGSTAG